MSARRDLEYIKRRSEEIHGPIYGFDKAIYVDCKTKFIVECLKCGNEFPIDSNHLLSSKRGCPPCGLKRRADGQRWTTAKFIEEGIKKYGDAHNYSKTIYTAWEDWLIIGCNSCGKDFRKQPRKYFGSTGSGCIRPGCKKQTSTPRPKEQVLQLLNEKNGERFEYDLSRYENVHSKIDAKCKLCNQVFETYVFRHIHQTFDNCPNCASSRPKKYGSLEDWKRSRAHEASIVHNDQYDYSKMDYTNANTKINGIRCKKCDTIFSMFWGIHMDGYGCPTCFPVRIHSKPERKWLADLNIPEENWQVKIPKTRWRVDALVGNTIYEFYGSFYHGDPRMGPPETINAVSKKTFGELYYNTMVRYNTLIHMGYEIKFVWELDWNIGMMFSDKHPTEMDTKIKTNTRLSTAHKENLAAKHRRSIEQYSLDGQFIKSYAGMTLAKKELTLKTDEYRSISIALRDRPENAIAIGYLWKFAPGAKKINYRSISA